MANDANKKIMLTDFLSADRILILPGKHEKDEVLNALIDKLAEVPEIGARDDIAWGIFHREGLLSTAIGNGIAVPHFHLSAIDETYMAMAIVQQGLAEYQTPDPQQVRLVFMIVSGKEQKTMHVKLLAEITRLFFDGRLKAAFLAASDPKTCMDILQRAQ